jgi:uncharacterized membrane protein
LLPLALDQYVTDWLDLLLRWLHVIAGIAWIGASFYFVLLDQSLRWPMEPGDEKRGVAGELWEVHGGGFYHVKKYRVAPHTLPSHLAWFKWEAYTTWLSGFALLVVLYYVDASASMIDPSVADLEPWEAVALSAGLLVVAWIVYDLLCRLVKNDRALWVCLAAGVVLTAWGTSELFSPRAAWLQVGAMLGTIMAATVFFTIIPAHWELIRAKQGGREPDPAPGIEAKRRSVHNNYLTLPVLLTMLAAHFGFLTGRDWAWLILLALMTLGAYARLFFNLRHAGRTHWWMPVAGAAAVLVLAFVLEPDDEPDEGTATPTPAAVARGRAVFASAGCGGCHVLADAGSTGAVGPNLDAARPSRQLLIERVTNGQGAMPAFRGRISETEIENVAAYVAAMAGG